MAAVEQGTRIRSQPGFEAMADSPSLKTTFLVTQTWIELAHTARL
jgi:hypothetical protein